MTALLWRRGAACGLLAASLLAVLAVAPVSAQTPSADGDDKVTGQTTSAMTVEPIPASATATTPRPTGA